MQSFSHHWFVEGLALLDAAADDATLAENARHYLQSMESRSWVRVRCGGLFGDSEYEVDGWATVPMTMFKSEQDEIVEVRNAIYSWVEWASDHYKNPENGEVGVLVWPHGQQRWVPSSVLEPSAYTEAQAVEEYLFSKYGNEVARLPVFRRGRVVSLDTDTGEGSVVLSTGEVLKLWDQCIPAMNNTVDYEADFSRPKTWSESALLSFLENANHVHSVAWINDTKFMIFTTKGACVLVETDHDKWMSTTKWIAPFTMCTACAFLAEHMKIILQKGAVPSHIVRSSSRMIKLWDRALSGKPADVWMPSTLPECDVRNTKKDPERDQLALTASENV